MAKRWTRRVFGLMALTALAACGQKVEKAAETPAPAAGAPYVAPSIKGQTLKIYNWSDYIDPALLKAFEAETGAKVVYDTFDSNEVLETKLLTGGTGYDLVVPSNHILPRAIAAGAVQPLDPAKTPNVKNLWPEIMAHMEPFDPGRKYDIPYMWGTIGLGYNVDAIAKRLPGVKIDSWSVVFDPANLAKLKDCGVYFLDASEDMYAVSMKYLGKDPNSKDIADYHAATDMLLKVRPYVKKFHSSEYIDALANGDICMAVGYSGDVLQAKARAKEASGKVKLDYAVPKEGSQVWFDVFAMPKDAPNPTAAYVFLDYMLRPDVIAKASNFTQYANANAPSRPMVNAEIRDNPNVYPTPEVFARLFVTTTKEQGLLRDVNRDWTRVKVGR
ncbi:spermidine/putrescine ABC transporter substrate-binding protein PotF [soil metagenome]